MGRKWLRTLQAQPQLLAILSYLPGTRGAGLVRVAQEAPKVSENDFVKHLLNFYNTPKKQKGTQRIISVF